MEACRVEGCSKQVTKAGHQFCLAHWKAERAGQVRPCDRCGRWHAAAGRFCNTCTPLVTPAEEESPAGFLSSTRLGKHFGLSSSKVNLILAELGWIERYVKGWVPTNRGNTLGANVREMKNGVPFVVWPESILTNAALLDSVAEHAGTAPRRPAARAGASAPSARDPSADFRARFPATFRTQDGHMVRSRAEVLIDNWLYMQGLIHAYERRLPIEEECYCDFYLPSGSGGGKGVYIEFWGRESDPRYRERMAAKKAIYAKHNLRLIELGDAEIERLDDVLPRMLLRFGIEAT